MFTVLVMLAAAAGPSPQLQQAIRSHFDATMRDGPANRYVWIKGSGINTDGVYCGRLNGKNAVGGYIGFVPFYIEHKGTRIINTLVGDDRSNIPLIETLCNLAGYKVSSQ